MTHSAGWANGITADETDLTRTDLRIMVRVTHGLYDVWQVRGRDTVIPSMPGQVARNRRFDKLVIVAEGWISGVGTNEAAQRADIVSTMDTIRDLMNPQEPPYTLEVTREDGSVVSIEARPVNVMWGDDDLPTYRTVSLEWLSIDPDWTAAGS